MDIPSVFCYNHGENYWNHQMHRIYWRIKGIFRAFGWMCDECGRIVEDDMVIRKHKVLQISISDKKIRIIVIKHYSKGKMCCSCCGEKNLRLLTVDHEKDNGKEERIKFGTGIRFYKYLIANDFPEGYAILCMNCNWGRSINDGICPHKQGKAKKR